MLFEKEYLQKQFEENSDGLSPEEFLKDRCGKLLDIWIEHDKGKEIYKISGPYWEVLHGILKKYAPEKLTAYEREVRPFDYFNEEVKKEYSYGDDLLNFMAALSYLEEEDMNLHQPNEVHYIELNGKTVPYMPNQSIEASLHLGRE